MLFSELYKIMVNKVTFVSFKGGDRPNSPPLNPTLILLGAGVATNKTASHSVENKKNMK